MWDLVKLWKKLTQLELSAIQLKDWDELHLRQKEKKALQASLAGLLDAKPLGDQAEGLLVEWQKLMKAEEENAALLGEQMEEIQHQLDSLGKSSRQLGRVRSSYNRYGDGYWSSYT